MLVIIIIVVLALMFDFINGFHDTANAIATSVSTKALTPRVAVIYAAILNFVGAVVFDQVAKNIGNGIANPMNLDPTIGLHIVIAALVSAILWNLLTWYFGIPSSSSHTLIGSMAGAVIAGAGSGAINWSGFIKIIKILVLSPFIAFAIGFILMYVVKWIVLMLGNGSPSKFNRSFRFMQIFSAGVQAFSHGSNDAQKAMGIIVFALVVGGYQVDTSYIPLWVKISAALAMAFGTSIGGWRIIKTIGRKIIKIEPMNGFTSDITATLVLQTATAYGMPLSTTHVITSSIIGTGTALRPKSINWGIVGKMVMTWVITIPISIVLAFLIYKLFYTIL
ncbi:inorganic phosphate transporter [Paenibacillus psychroresistens]|uniref:Inorganic phosphate transporter n=1 Tax=Paenibacillus psychroresistens TaxID=1778678 RepID=A0A6B8RQH3_9BACL|nr:inorganic phosphate transporter [Paenibacillus psychroresistens]QGQ98620.1 inorganic phosphate transporter [Paenibacillus psychroresistens]